MRRRAFVRRMVMAALASAFIEVRLPTVSTATAGYFDVPASGFGFGSVSVPAPPDGMAVRIDLDDGGHTVVKMSHSVRQWEFPVMPGTKGTWEWVES